MADDPVEQDAANAEGGATTSKKIEYKVQIFEADIPEELQTKAIAKASEAMAQFTIEKDVATEVKKHFDEDSGGTWHCVAGRSFGCSVTHETKYLFFFKLDSMHILLFKSQE